MVEPLRHRQTKGAANRHAPPKATASHSYSTRLNLGDCFTYAAAKAAEAPLLHKDEGFWSTDVRQAWERKEG